MGRMIPGLSYTDTGKSIVPGLGYTDDGIDNIPEPPTDGELRLNGVLIPDMMIGSTRVAEAWLNGVKVFDNANY